MIGRHERVKRDEAEWQGLKRSKKLEGVSSRDGKQGLRAASKCYFTESGKTMMVQMRVRAKSKERNRVR